MQLNNRQVIPARQSLVWEALNDPEILAQSIPGCELVERVDHETLRATVKTKIGPIGARFSGIVKLSEVDAPNSYVIAFNGEGGPSGFVSGGARVRLSEDGANTILEYSAEAKIGGKIAQIGSRLIDSVAMKTASQFFAKFSEVVATKQPTDAPGVEP